MSDVTKLDTISLLRYWWDVSPPVKALRATTPSIMRGHVLALCDTAESQAAEIEALREALEKIRDREYAVCVCRQDAQEFAREFLAKKGGA